MGGNEAKRGARVAGDTGSRAALYVKGAGLLFVVLAVGSAIAGGGLADVWPLLVPALLVIAIGELVDIRHAINRQGRRGPWDG